MALRDEEITKILGICPQPLRALIDKCANLETREDALSLLTRCIEVNSDILFTKLTCIAIGLGDPGGDHGTALSILREFLTSGNVTYWNELAVEISDIALISIKPVNGQNSNRLWSELMIFMFDCFKTTSRRLQKFALIILERAPEFVREAILANSHHEQKNLQQRLHNRLAQLLVSPTDDLKTCAFKGLLNLLVVLSPEDRELFQDLLPTA
ncbi:importin-5-like protein [Tanacetum coccineum]